MTVKTDLNPVVTGDDLTFTIRFNNDDGDPLDVVGDQVYLTIKSTLELTDAEAELQIDYLIPDSGSTRAGVVTVPVTKTDTAIPAAKYHYDFQWTKNASGAGEVETVQIGYITFIEGVTKS